MRFSKSTINCALIFFTILEEFWSPFSPLNKATTEWAFPNSVRVAKVVRILRCRYRWEPNMCRSGWRSPSSFISRFCPVPLHTCRVARWWMDRSRLTESSDAESTRRPLPSSHASARLPFLFRLQIAQGFPQSNQFNKVSSYFHFRDPIIDTCTVRCRACSPNSNVFSRGRCSGLQTRIDLGCSRMCERSTRLSICRKIRGQPLAWIMETMYLVYMKNWQ